MAAAAISSGLGHFTRLEQDSVGRTLFLAFRCLAGIVKPLEMAALPISAFSSQHVNVFNVKRQTGSLHKNLKPWFKYISGISHKGDPDWNRGGASPRQVKNRLQLYVRTSRSAREIGTRTSHGPYETKSQYRMVSRLTSSPNN